MRILGAHTYYRQRGGEDIAFDAEMELLRARGHEVRTFTASNGDASGAALATQLLWNRRAAHDLRRVVVDWKPDVVHVHNTFPSLSPSILHAASAKVPVVTTLHNYRLVCANALLLRAEKACEECLETGHQLPGIVNRCYRDSAAASAAVAVANVTHKALKVWVDNVSIAVVLTAFARQKLASVGFRPDQVVVKPNFVDVPPKRKTERPFIVYAGRLSAEKGVRTLLDAFTRVRAAIELRVVGSGPLESLVRSAAANDPRIRYVGAVERPRVIELLRDAMMAVCPSTCYEGFPLVIAEAYACGTPVIGSDLGSLAELVKHEETGLRFPVGDCQDLAVAIDRLAADQPLRRLLGERARNRYERCYTADETHRQLMEIYERAINGRN